MKHKKIEEEASKILEEISNDKLAIKINVTAQIVKNAKDAQLTFSLAKDGEKPIAIVKEIKDINSSFLTYFNHNIMYNFFQISFFSKFLSF